MNKLVTLRMIAERAGVHVTTVSLALRNSKSLPPETKARLKALAVEMGYRPDPALTALQAYRRQAGASSPGLAITYLCFNPKANWKSVGRVHFEIYQGCQKRCRELGYQLELIWVRDPQLSLRRCHAILKTRNPAGIVLSELHGGRSRYSMEISDFPAVRVGQGLVHPRLHAVGNNQFQNVKLAVRKAYHLGYRRVGLALMNPFDESVNNFWSGGFWSEQQKRKREDWVLPFLPPQWEEALFAEWMRREKPEVIITNHTDNFIPAWLHRMKLRLPDDIGFILIGSTDASSAYAGVDEDNATVGRTIIDKLVAVIHRNERGIPDNPELTLIAGAWREGDSVRNQRRGTQRQGISNKIAAKAST